jgi:hypothetical protein
MAFHGFDAQESTGFTGDFGFTRRSALDRAAGERHLSWSEMKIPAPE